ncbi:NO-inducible flavohemoprotein [Lacibacterium aquatile]|uniref:nitric oxide dioxygenase n=1 Tax=Lacibacterium aquatile TaxID=1168082 RepID=A0ABW5DXM8_9PROT
MLTQRQIEIVKATAPVVAENALAITSTFYPILFQDFPEVRAVFNQTHQGGGAQPKALANAIIAYAANIERFEQIKPALRGIVEKHVSLNIAPHQYEAVGASLMKAIGKVLGAAVTDEVADAWGAAYWQLAEFLIGEEEKEYTRKAELTGGWRGPRKMRLKEKVVESDVITSFYFEAADGGELMSFQPGQFLGLKLTINGEVTHRNYSLSDLPNGRTYRISVKRERHGLASRFLHDDMQVGQEIEIYPPSGEFTLKPGKGDVVLITAGVGQTPAIPMAKRALADGRKVTYLHAALNSGTHAFRNSIAALAMAYPSLKTVYGYSEPFAEDNADFTGFVTPEILADALSGQDVAAYIVGPKPFMRTVIDILKALKVPTDNIHFEFFGPAEELA